MIAFLRDHASLDTLLNMVDSFSLHSGLKINFEKTVISLARNRNITVKKVIKILGVHFTYDHTLWRKLNFDRWDSEDYTGKVELLELEKLNGPWAYSDNKIFCYSRFYV